MDRARHKRNYGLHSWSGIVLGLFVYVVAFTGCIALFHHEIQSWEDPAKRITISETPVKIGETWENWIQEKADGKPIGFARITYPTVEEPYYWGGITVEKEGGGNEFVVELWDPNTGEVIPNRGDGLSEWLLDFHRDLMWPEGLGGRTAGRTIVGIAGVILMLSILTGVIAHTKIVQEFFTLRYFRSVRLKWQDTHKVLGLWGLPFYTMIAFTGAVLGVVAILGPLVAVVAFKGDTESLFAAVLGEETKPTGVAAQMIPLEELEKYRFPESDIAPYMIITHNWGDDNGEFELFYTPDTELSTVDILHVDGVSGEIKPDTEFTKITPANRVVNAVSPLHYGTYGGVFLKFLYFLLGLALAVITALGLMMWIERRLHGNEGNKSKAFYRRLSHLVTGVTMGLPVATAALFYHDKLYLAAESSRLYWTGITYFAVWTIGLIYAFIRKNDYQTTRELLGVTAILCIGIPILNLIMTGNGLDALFESSHKVAAYVDLTFLIVGLISIATAYKLPSQRTESKKNAQITQRFSESVAE